jgi:hypothetical protein
MRSLLFYLFATLFLTVGLFNQWQQVVAADTLQDDEPMQDEFLFDPVRVDGGKFVEGPRRTGFNPRCSPFNPKCRHAY